MSLAEGSRIGAYEITGRLGAGGMGEVYRARDTKLDRDVAIKILPESFAGDADRVMRFEREAKTLASLNHPHIAQIHGFEQSGGTSALVMELVDGEDLSQRIARGPLPINEALPIARQIADALEAAHDAGIIHRDLKPANIKVRDDGTVKVLDFGLAKAFQPGAGSGEPGAGQALANSPTITSPAMTQAGIILGTAAYMSPEQAKGKAVDRRTDLWAFGCVLFEMLTGARAFGGEDVTETLARIVMGEPQWSLLPPATPSTIHRVLRRCLQKDARRRLDSAAVARLEIESASAPEELSATPAIAAPSSRRWQWAGWIAAGISGVAVVVLVGWPRTSEAPSFSLEVPTPGLSLGTGQSLFAVSPDGLRLAMRTMENDEPVLSVKRLDQFDINTLRATTGASWPFWSPDNRFVGSFVNSRLQLSPVDGGPPQVVPGVTSANLTQGAWNADGVILYSAKQGILRTSISGATPVAVTSIDQANGEHSHLYPRFLPDGVHFLYLAGSASQTPFIFVGSLDGTPAQRLLSANGHAEFAPPDHLLFVRDGTLMAQRFDVRRLTLVGEPAPLINDIYTSTANSLAGFSVSRTGVLVYRPGGGTGRQLQWVDRSGNVSSRVGSTGEFRNVSLSPDGRVMAVHRPDNGGDVWLTDLERGTDTRFTVDPAIDDNPVWTPDGRSIAFVSNRDGGIFNVYLKNAGGIGADELLLKTAAHKRLGGWTPDGAYLLYDEADPRTNRDIWMLPAKGDRQPVKVIGGPFNEDEPSISPDGRWLAYSSDESGTYQIYVQAFPKGDRKWRVSSAATTVRHPRWSRDGKELFFDVTGRMAVVRMTTSADGIVAGAEQRLFFGLLNLPPHNFDVSLDGTRILAILSPQGAGVEAPPLRVVTNWTRLLPK